MPTFLLFATMLFLPIVGIESLPQSLLNDINLVAQQGAGTEEGRAAWQRICQQGGPDLLPHLLKAMNTPDIVRANWLRSAFDRVLERQLKKNPKGIPVADLLKFIKDSANQGRARRFALSVVEEIMPGTKASLLAQWLEDAEFRYDAVDALLDQAKTEAEKNRKAEALAAYRKAFQSSREVDQVRRAAAGLLDLGVEVSMSKHLGFLTDWYIIGPFDAKGKKGFTTAYPPEKNVDLNAAYPGKFGKVKWKRYQVTEPSPRVNFRHMALVNLREQRALGDADDAVAFAYTVISVPKPIKVEFRGAADDNFIVWVNGKKVFGFEEYTNGVRHDRHRFPVSLQAGKNTVLVKVCQSPPYIAPNWEFFLRLADRTGFGVPFEHQLPPQ